MFLLPYSLVPLALIDRFIYRFPCLWIAPIFQLPVTVEDVITAPLQFFSHRGFARAGDSLDKIISLTHGPYLFCPSDWFCQTPNETFEKLSEKASMREFLDPLR